jgi:dTDP-4-dehydrorhamnose reductase
VILVTGAFGQLGSAFRRRLGQKARFVGRSELDLAAAGVRSTIRSLNPSLVINCAAYTAVDRAEDDQSLAELVNGSAVGDMAAGCDDVGARFVTYSTDYVFDGTKSGPYVESDPTSPINAYGRSKQIGEALAHSANERSLVVRTSWVLSGTHKNFASVMIDLLAKGPVTVVADQYGHPTLVNDLVEGTLQAVEGDVTGVFHMANAGVTSWYELARTIAELSGKDPDLVSPCSTDEYPTRAARPLNSVLDSERVGELGVLPLPDFHDSLAVAVREIAATRSAP